MLFDIVGNSPGNMGDPGLNSRVADKRKSLVQNAYYCIDVWRSSRSIYRSGNVGSKERTAFCPTEMDSSNGGLHESQLGFSGAVRTGLPGGFNLLRILANGIDLDDSVGKARQIKLWSEKTDHQHRYDDEEKGYYHF